MTELLQAEHLIALVTLTSLEVILGIDNIVFIAVLTGKLPPEQRSRGRRIGLLLAMVARILLLLCITWVMRLTTPLFSVFEQEFSGRDLILLGGGLFLLAKATFEIHDKIEKSKQKKSTSAVVTFGKVLVQILILDLVFSLDSVITAVGMADHIVVMITAVMIAVGVMMVFANPISDFVERHPTMKMLALSFLLLIGVMLVAESLGQHIGKGYIYFAMAFSLFVEILNLKIRPSLPGLGEDRPGTAS